MISLRYYLDTRRPSRRTDGRFPLKLAITRHGDTAMMSVAAFAGRDEWDPKRQRMKNRVGYGRQVNDYLVRFMMEAERVLQDLVLSGAATTMPATAVRDALQRELMDAGESATVRECIEALAGEKRAKTAGIFRSALAALDVCGKFLNRPISAITTDDIKDVDTRIRSRYAPNTRNSYMGVVAQTFRRAHRDGTIREDPCRDLRFPTPSTKSRALTLEQLRAILNAEPATKTGRDFLDFFRFTFYARAANAADIAWMTPESIFNGRLEYVRRKTGKRYSVRVEPELQAVIDRRGDEAHLFARVATRAKFQDYCRDCNKYLGDLSESLGMPRITLYWARHTFASLLLETGAPIEIIAAALGHSYGPRITMGYVAIREKAVDDAVRRLFDYVAGTWTPGKEKPQAQSEPEPGKNVSYMLKAPSRR